MKKTLSFNECYAKIEGKKEKDERKSVPLQKMVQKEDLPIESKTLAAIIRLIRQYRK